MVIFVGYLQHKIKYVPLFPADTANFISKLSLKKLINMGKVYSSYLVTRYLRKPVQWGRPFTVSIEPTTACNLRCPECPSGLRSFTRDTGNLKTDAFHHIIGQLQDHLAYLIFYFQGEPFINPGFLDMVSAAHQKKIYTITSTNGHFLNRENAVKTVKSGLDRLIISLDGTTQEVYEQYRVEGRLDNVIRGIQNVVRAKKEARSRTPHIILQFLVVAPNEHQIDEVYALAREWGVDEVKLKSAQIYDYENGNRLIPQNLKYSRYRKNEDGTYSLNYTVTDHCWKLWHSCVITWDGDVVPCCFDKDAQYVMGNVLDQPFETVWQNAAYSSFRSRLLKGRKEIDICANCSEGCSVFH